MADSVDTKLKARRSAVLHEIAESARKGQTDILFGKTEELRRLDEVLHGLASLAERGLQLLDPTRERSHNHGQPVKANHAAEPSAHLTAGREAGRALRAAFLKSAADRGLRLTPSSGAIYRTPSGTRVGIAAATERRQNRWFFGLKSGGFDAAVLIAQSSSGKVADVCLPADFIRKIGSRLSVSVGQSKFNLVRRDGHLQLYVPGMDPVSVEELVGAVDQLR